MVEDADAVGELRPGRQPAGDAGRAVDVHQVYPDLLGPAVLEHDLGRHRCPDGLQLAVLLDDAVGRMRRHPELEGLAAGHGGDELLSLQRLQHDVAAGRDRRRSRNVSEQCHLAERRARLKHFSLDLDHSLLEDYKEAKPDMTEEEERNFPHKNVITRALGMRETVQVDIRAHQIKSGDVYVLCSDGLSGMVTDDQILEAYRYLASEESVFCEPASAASVAGLLDSTIPAGSTVVCVLTGHGLKDPETALGIESEMQEVEPRIEAIEEAMGLAR